MTNSVSCVCDTHLLSFHRCNPLSHREPEALRPAVPTGVESRRRRWKSHPHHHPGWEPGPTSGCGLLHQLTLRRFRCTAKLSGFISVLWTLSNHSGVRGGNCWRYASWGGREVSGHVGWDGRTGYSEWVLVSSVYIHHLRWQRWWEWREGGY